MIFLVHKLGVGFTDDTMQNLAVNRKIPSQSKINEQIIQNMLHKVK